MDSFLKALQIDRLYMYVFEYGAPIGFRIAMKRPDSILGIISQNGNVYEEGLGKKWEARAEYWKNPTEELRKQYQSAFARETVIGQYTFGKEDPSFIWAGAEAFRKDLPQAVIIPVNSDHFALENCCAEIASEILRVFAGQE